jgi:hypothetical protein
MMPVVLLRPEADSTTTLLLQSNASSHQQLSFEEAKKTLRSSLVLDLSEMNLR